MTVTFKLEGLKELEGRLKNMPFKLAVRLEKRALKKALDPIYKEAEANLARQTTPKTGNLAKSFLTRNKTFRKFYIKAELVNYAPHAHLIEYGHWLKKGRIFQRIIRWIGERPFMRPALDAKAAEALEIFRSETEKALEIFEVKNGN